MGTIIALELAGMELASSKNSIGMDHGMLFQEHDRKRIRSDQIDYGYFEENNADPGSMEMSFCRPLAEVVPRLELLGFTLLQVRKEYEACSHAWHEHRESMAEDDESPVPDLMSFDEFCALASQCPVAAMDDTFVDFDAEDKVARVRGQFGDDVVNLRVPHFSTYDTNGYSERSYFGSLIGILHPYSVLRLLAINSANLSADVTWQYGPLVDSGWATADEFIAGARRAQTFLVATEGSSDAHILKRALELLMPGVSDFFRFIDVSDRHPFPGTGNLLKFAEGLAKIDVQNQVIFLFDNDAEGYDAYQQLGRLKLPSNMRAIMLPEHDDFRSFPAQGPEGLTRADINRRAAAIECYLDLELKGYPPAKVIWTNFKERLGVYHGSLDHKESYTKAFMEQTPESLSTGGYDTRRLTAVLDALVNECSSIAADAATLAAGAIAAHLTYR